MDRYAEALGDKAHNIVSGNRRTAAGEFDHAVVDVLHNDAGGSQLGLVADGGGILGGGICGFLLVEAQDLLLDPVDRLHGGEAAVADGCIHIVQIGEGELFQQQRLQRVVGNDGGGNARCAAAPLQSSDGR